MGTIGPTTCDQQGARWTNLSVFTWNARALLSYHVHMARQKWAVVQAASLKYDVVCIQEAHGDDHALRLATTRFDTTHVGVFSAGLGTDTGGVITWIRRSLLASEAIQRHDIVPGRVLEAQATLPERAKVTIVNIHNVDVPRTAIEELPQRAQDARQEGRHMFVLTRRLQLRGR